MRVQNSIRNQRGMTLVEATLAIAILSVILALSAQALGTFYGAMQMHRERTASVQVSRSVLNAIREKRSEFSDDFPSELLEWIKEKNSINWESYLLIEDSPDALASHTIVATCENLEGDAAATGDSPIIVHVVSNWITAREHPISATVSTALVSQ